MEDVLKKIQEKSELSVFLGLIFQAGLENILTKKEPFTIFAPTNQAIESLSFDEIEKLKKDKEKLRNTLLSHVVHGIILKKDIVNMDEITTVEGEEIEVAIKNGDIFFGYAKIVDFDIKYDYGVIHILDRFIVFG